MKQESTKMPMEKRLLFAGGAFLLLAGGAAIVWIFGMLMLMFAGDAASGSKIPVWFELTMLVGWPVTLGLMAVGIPILIAIGPRLRWVIAGSAVLMLIPAAMYVFGFIKMISFSM